ALPGIDGEDVAVLRIRNEPVGSEAERWRQPPLTTGVDQPGQEQREKRDQDSSRSPGEWREGASSELDDVHRELPFDGPPTAPPQRGRPRGDPRRGVE